MFNDEHDAAVVSLSRRALKLEPLRVEGEGLGSHIQYFQPARPGRLKKALWKPRPISIGLCGLWGLQAGR